MLHEGMQHNADQADANKFTTQDAPNKCSSLKSH